MAKLKILEFPDPRLRTKASPVERVDDELRVLIADMFETMYAAPGIGLAATQVDVHRRLLVVGAQSTDTLVNAFDRAMFGEGDDDLANPGSVH